MFFSPSLSGKEALLFACFMIAADNKEVEAAREKLAQKEVKEREKEKKRKKKEETGIRDRRRKRREDGMGT